MRTSTVEEDGPQFGLATRALAGLCRRCGICPYAVRRPDSVLDKVMRWHRTWCPAWKAHTRVFGEKQLT